MASQVRLKNEMKNMMEKHSDEFFAYPLDDDYFNWHFTIKGPKCSEFEGGLYHGNIHLENSYPETKPLIQFFTPNGRFATNTQLCIYLNSQNSNLWNTQWTLINMLEALINYMPIQESHTGSIAESTEKRKEYAKTSIEFKCDKCGLIAEHIKGNNVNTK